MAKPWIWLLLLPVLVGAGSTPPAFSRCEVAAAAWLRWVELICPAPRERTPLKGECRLWHQETEKVTEGFLADLRAACTQGG